MKKTILASMLPIFLAGGAAAQSIALTVQTNGFSNLPMAGVRVAAVTFKATGEPDPALTVLAQTNASGTTTFALLAGRPYQIVLSSPGYFPTARDQINDPSGNYTVTANADLTKLYYLFPAGQDRPLYTLNVAVSSIPATNDLLIGEVYVTQNRESVAYGFFRATATTGTTFPVFNIPPAGAAAFAARVVIPGRDKALEVILSSGIPQTTTLAMDMTQAFAAQKFEGTASTVAASVEGVIKSTDSLPVPAMRVSMFKFGNFDPACNCVPQIFRQETFTDAGGRFAFFNVPPDTGYQLYGSRLGYESFGLPPLTILAGGATQRFFFFTRYASFVLNGVLQYGGNPISTGFIQMHGDGDRWHGASGSTDTYADVNFAMRADANARVNGDGTFQIAGLPDGNVNLNAGFRGGNYWFNAGANGQTDFNSGYRSGDDKRITISSITFTQAASPCAAGCPAGTTIVRDANGAILSTGPVVLNIQPPAGAANGRISGTVTFITSFTVSALTPLVIPSTLPITIMAIQDFQGQGSTQRLGVANLSGTFTAKTTTYSIAVPTSTYYRMDLFSSDWAKATDFNDQADLSQSTSAFFNYVLTRAGRLIGNVKLPDGTGYRPAFGPQNDPKAHYVNLDIRGTNTQGRCYVQVDEVGFFECPNMAPGKYQVNARPEGQGAVWPRTILDDVSVFEARTTTVTVKLINPIYVQPQIFGLPAVSTQAFGYAVLAIPAGAQLNEAKLKKLLFSDPQYASDYSTTTASWSVLKMAPGLYDFYLVTGNNYKVENGSFYAFVNFIGQLKNTAVQKSDSNPNLGTAAQPISIGILGSVGPSSITGRIRGTKIFTDDDFKRIFANFEGEIIPLIPAVLLYDNAGDLKGFALALPDEVAIFPFITAIQSQDPTAALAILAARPLRYLVPGLPPAKYTAVFMNPNYPPVVKEVTLAAGSNTVDFDFDQQRVLTGAIAGVVKSSATGQGIPDATVSFKHRTVEKLLKTDVNGSFNAANLPPGIYRIEATKPGFTTAGDKAALGGNGALNLTFVLFSSTNSIRGTVYLRKFPTPAVTDGVRIVSYDETANVADSDAYLPKQNTLTDTDGTYEVPAVIPGHIYKIAVFTPGKVVETLNVTAGAGVTSAPDIVLKDSPPDIVVRVRKSLDTGKVDLKIKSPKELRSVPAVTYNPGQVYDSTSAVSLTIIPGPENTFLGQFTPTPTQRHYTIRVVAGEDQNQLEKVVLFDQTSSARTDQSVQEAAIAGGEVSLDSDQQEYSGVELDAGSLTTTTGTASDFSNLIGGFFSALPSVRMVKTARGTSESVTSALTGLLASEVYEINLSSAQQNKSLTLTIKYDKEKVTDTASLSIYQYNATSGDWEAVPGNYTADPLSGVVSVNVESIQEASEGSSATSPLGRHGKARRGYGRAAVSPQGVFVPSAVSATSQTGQFAVFTAAPGTGVAYAGEKFELYNMPNPFDLKSKTVSLSLDRGAAFSSNTTSVRGTLIKYHLPAAKSGVVKLLIYNVAGERVRQLEEGSRAGGYIYYSEWDGKNDRGDDCASGVYFLLTQVNGDRLGTKAHKMALVK